MQTSEKIRANTAELISHLTQAYQLWQQMNLGLPPTLFEFGELCQDPALFVRMCVYQRRPLLRSMVSNPAEAIPLISLPEGFDAFNQVAAHIGRLISDRLTPPLALFSKRGTVISCNRLEAWIAKNSNE